MHGVEKATLETNFLHDFIVFKLPNLSGISGAVHGLQQLTTEPLIEVFPHKLNIDFPPGFGMKVRTPNINNIDVEATLLIQVETYTIGHGH